MGEISKELSKNIEGRSPLLPDRHPTRDFFICDVFDAVPKGDMASMEHPIFSLSTKPDLRVRRYEHGNVFVEVKPGSDGLATVHDRDVLIFCISQLMAGLNSGEPLSRTVRIRAYDLLKATNRMTNGQGYDGLKAALGRLRSTTIETNIVTGGKEQFDVFGLIDRGRVVKESRDGRMQEIEIVLSEWLFEAIQAKEVLTLHRNYFRLRKPLERRIYEIARKHCNRQREWRISLSLLQKKCGSSSTNKEFARLVRNIVKHDKEHNHFPDYALSLDGDMMVFRSRGSIAAIPKATEVSLPPLASETYEQARSYAPGWDIRMIEREWREWTTEAPRNVDKAFLGFCSKWYEKRGTP